MEQPARLKKPRWVSVSERLPAPDQFVRYRTKDFSFAGYCNRNGKWADGKERPEKGEVLKWLEPS